MIKSFDRELMRGVRMGAFAGEAETWGAHRRAGAIGLLAHGTGLGDSIARGRAP